MGSPCRWHRQFLAHIDNVHLKRICPKKKQYRLGCEKMLCWGARNTRLVHWFSKSSGASCRHRDRALSLKEDDSYSLGRRGEKRIFRQGRPSRERRNCHFDLSVRRCFAVLRHLRQATMHRVSQCSRGPCRRRSGSPSSDQSVYRKRVSTYGPSDHMIPPSCRLAAK